MTIICLYHAALNMNCLFFPITKRNIKRSELSRPSRSIWNSCFKFSNVMNATYWICQEVGHRSSSSDNCGSRREEFLLWKSVGLYSRRCTVFTLLVYFSLGAKQVMCLWGDYLDTHRCLDNLSTVPSILSQVCADISEPGVSVCVWSACQTSFLFVSVELKRPGTSKPALVPGLIWFISI